MHAQVAEKAEKIAALCDQSNVEYLALIGSATGDEFDPSQSDLDFVVRFAPATPVQHATRYFQLLHALEDLFNRRIDLIEIDAIENPYFLKTIEATQQVLYAA